MGVAYRGVANISESPRQRRQCALYLAEVDRDSEVNETPERGHHEIDK